MSKEAPGTIAIILGASNFPEMGSIGENKSFKNSAEEFKKYLESKEGLSLGKTNVLDLFDDEPSSADQLVLIENWLRLHRSAENLIMYYVGHGHANLRTGDLHLIIKRTKTQQIELTSIPGKMLGQAIKDSFPGRVFVIIDCCFSGKLNNVETWQNSGLGLAGKIVDDLSSVFDWPVSSHQAPQADAFQNKSFTAESPNSGVGLLTSAPAGTFAVGDPKEKFTRFSSELLDILKRGSRILPKNISLDDLRREIRTRLLDKYGENFPLPESSAPRANKGDVAQLRYFPNQFYQTHTIKGSTPVIPPNNQSEFFPVVNYHKSPTKHNKTSGTEPPSIEPQVDSRPWPSSAIGSFRRFGKSAERHFADLTPFISSAIRLRPIIKSVMVWRQAIQSRKQKTYLDHVSPHGDHTKQSEKTAAAIVLIFGLAAISVSVVLVAEEETTTPTITSSPKESNQSPTNPTISPAEEQITQVNTNKTGIDIKESSHLTTQAEKLTDKCATYLNEELLPFSCSIEIKLGRDWQAQDLKFTSMRHADAPTDHKCDKKVAKNRTIPAKSAWCAEDCISRSLKNVKFEFQEPPSCIKAGACESSVAWQHTFVLSLVGGRGP